MKIVLISPAHPLRGGIAASSERLASELQNMGHQVVVYSFALQYPSLLFPGKTQYSDAPAPVGLSIKTRLNSINPLNWIKVSREIALEYPDRIIVRFWLPFMAPCLGSTVRLARWWARSNLRITALVDNIIPHEKRLGDKLLARFFVRSCNDFVVMSHAVEDEIRAFLPIGAPVQKVRFAPHPVYDIYGAPIPKEEARRQLNLPIDIPLVLFFGFIRPYKGLDLLLEALAHTPYLHALVAGECYSDWQPYQRLIEKHQLQSRVHLHTYFIKDKNVALYFSAADLIAQPYKSATQSGISQIAYHFEKPMLVTDVGGLPEIVRHGVSGYVVRPEALAIAEAMQDFFERGRASVFTEGAGKEKKRFSWRNLAETILHG